ncbi:40S small subunit processome assembly factor 1 isoform X1 [Rhinoraja longicauda]
MGESGGEAERRLLERVLGLLYQCEESEVDGKKNKGEKRKLKGGRGKRDKTEKKIVCSEAQAVPCTEAAPRTNNLHTKTTAISSAATSKCLEGLRRELLGPENEQTVCIKAEGRREPDNRNGTVSNKKPVEVVRFTGVRQKRKLPPVTAEISKVTETAEQDNMNQNAFNLERARLEVHRFGITGYRKEQQRILEQERAIMLGARPPKREYVNYKTYQEMVKNKETAKQMKMNSKSALSKEKKDEGRRHKKSGRAPSGQVGRFKNGALILSDNDIKRLKVSSKSKHR